MLWTWYRLRRRADYGETSRPPIGPQLAQVAKEQAREEKAGGPNAQACAAPESYEQHSPPAESARSQRHEQWQ